MLNCTRLAAVGFDNGQNTYRVFYQDSDLLLKESCFEESRGWYVRENCTVASDAKKLTPLAAVCWANGREIRVYYMNNTNQILERKWSANDTEKPGAWEPGSTVQCTTPGPLTQLAATCVEETGGSVTLRLFYQSAHRELRQTYYSSVQAEWKDVTLELDNGGRLRPMQGTSFAASTRLTTRVFYLTGPRDVALAKLVGNKWKSSQVALYRRVRAEQVQLLRVATKTPIAIAPPLLMDNIPVQDRLATFFVTNDGKLLNMVFNTDSDDFEDQRTDDRSRRSRPKVSAQYEPDSELDVEAGGSIAVASSFEDNALVFYQSSSTAISAYDIIHGYEIRTGIPTSEGGASQADISGGGTNSSSDAAANRQNEVGRSYGSGLLTTNELLRFEFPMTDKLQNPSYSQHQVYSVTWTAAWQQWYGIYVSRGRVAGIRNWDISELRDVVNHFEVAKSWFLPRAQDTNWDRYWNMPSFKCCDYVRCQETLWRLAWARKLSNAKSLSHDQWGKILQNFSLFLWFDFYVMRYDLTNPGSTILPAVYSYAFTL
ncbi:hypothetical protein F4777DRAFT_522653 [Nemania sp. FL0916]|nr:hypothetical protein F4777DRAFT_522653 [Nemania sp. FL0916]